MSVPRRLASLLEPLLTRRNSGTSDAAEVDDSHGQEDRDQGAITVLPIQQSGELAAPGGGMAEDSARDPSTDDEANAAYARRDVYSALEEPAAHSESDDLHVSDDVDDGVGHVPLIGDDGSDSYSYEGDEDGGLADVADVADATEVVGQVRRGGRRTAGALVAAASIRAAHSDSLSLGEVRAEEARRGGRREAGAVAAREAASYNFERVTYDTSIPGEHRYLGAVQDFQNSGSGSIFPMDEGSVVEVPFCTIYPSRLFPGVIWPLRFTTPAEMRIGYAALTGSSRSPKGVLAVLHMGDDYGAHDEANSTEPWRMGTLGEIRQVCHCPDGSLNLLILGRQAAEVVFDEEEIEEVRRRGELGDELDAGEGAVSAADAGPVREGTPRRGAALDRRRTNLAGSLRMLFSATSSSGGMGGGGALLAKMKVHQEPSTLHVPCEVWGGCTTRRSVRRHGYQGGCSTYWPPWVYRPYDSRHLCKKVREAFKQLKWSRGEEIVSSLPPDAMANWLANKLPMDAKARWQLLRLSSVHERLKKELEIMNNLDVISCRDCNQRLASYKDIVHINNTGPMNAYVNSHGVVHETLTLKQVEAVALQGSPCTDNSWFPGYAWTIMTCRTCGNHLGWRFTAVEARIWPRCFFGLTRSSLLTHTDPSTANDAPFG